MIHVKPRPLPGRDGDLFVVPHDRRPMVRMAAARFDRYLAADTARHSAAVEWPFALT